MTELVTARVAQFVPPAPRSSTETLTHAAAALVPEVPVRVAPESRPLTAPSRTGRDRWAVALQGLVHASLVLTCAALVALFGAPAPLPVVAVAAVAWPALLAVLARPGTAADGGTSAPSDALLGAAGTAVVCWLLHPLAGATTSAEDVAPLLVLLAAATALSTTVRPLARPLRVVVAGAASEVSTALDELGPSTRFEVVGVCLPPQLDDAPGQGIPSYDGTVRLPVGLEDSMDGAADAGADAVLLMPGGDLPPALVRRLLWRAQARGLHAYVATGLLDVAPTRASVVPGMGLHLLHVRPAPTRGPGRLLKGAVDRTAALLGLVVLAPLMAGIAVMIRRETPGPALFRQQRIGRDGRPFTMYKFRTMRQSAEVEKQALVGRNDCDAVLFKMRSDPRITALGSRLRRYSIDELPQLWNVATGQMSLVGPRPALPDEVERYDLDPRRRLAVKPGLTGLWQVSGRSDLTWEESVRLDVRYVDNWSLGLDASILARTARAVLGHHGAY